VSAVLVGLAGHRNALMRRIVSVAKEFPASEVRFVTVRYDDPTELSARIRRLRDRPQAVLLTGRWHFDRVSRAGELAVPVATLPLRAENLYAALLTAERAAIDRVSIDTLDTAMVHEAYQELGLDDTEVRVMPYDERATRDAYLDFHLDAARSGAGLAATTFREVERALRAAGMPVVLLHATRATIRDGIREAISLGRGTRLAGQQVAMIGVQLPEPGDGLADDPGNYPFQEVRASVYRLLLEMCRASGALVLPRSDRLFLVTLTRAGLDALTDNLTSAPFVAACRAAHGLQLQVGIGLGPTAQIAARHAVEGIGHAVAASADAFVVSAAGTPQRLDAVAGFGIDRPPPRGLTILRRLVEARRGVTDSDGASVLTVGAEDVAEILAVSPRTALRTCRHLVDVGLAWPVPAVRAPQGGRPTQQFQLLAEKLG